MGVPAYGPSIISTVTPATGRNAVSRTTPRRIRFSAAGSVGGTGVGMAGTAAVPPHAEITSDRSIIAVHRFMPHPPFAIEARQRCRGSAGADGNLRGGTGANQ